MDQLIVHVVRQLIRKLESDSPRFVDISSMGEIMPAIFMKAAPYADDAMNLPVESVDAAILFYQTVMGFKVTSRTDAPRKSVVLSRDNIQIGLAENGGDPSQEGCFFEVDDVEPRLTNCVQMASTE